MCYLLVYFVGSRFAVWLRLRLIFLSLEVVLGGCIVWYLPRYRHMCLHYKDVTNLGLLLALLRAMAINLIFAGPYSAVFNLEVRRQTLLHRSVILSFSGQIIICKVIWVLARLLFKITSYFLQSTQF